jgi:hypothetical protein
MLGILNKLDALIRETPDIQAYFEVADGHDEVVVRTPPGISKTSNTLINLALPIFFSQTLYVYQRALSYSD